MRAAAHLVGLAPAPGSGKKAPRSGALADLPPPLIGRSSRGLSGGLEFLGAKAICKSVSLCVFVLRASVTRNNETDVWGNERTNEYQRIMGNRAALHSPQPSRTIRVRIRGASEDHHTAPDHTTTRLPADHHACEMRDGRSHACRSHASAEVSTQGRLSQGRRQARVRVRRVAPVSGRLKGRLCLKGRRRSATSQAAGLRTCRAPLEAVALGAQRGPVSHAPSRGSSGPARCSQVCRADRCALLAEEVRGTSSGHGQGYCQGRAL